MIYVAIVLGMHSEKNDPWRPKDKTCLKCNKIILNATKQEEADVKRAEREEIEQKVGAALILKRTKQRAISVAKADKRYTKWLTIRNKAK